MLTDREQETRHEIPVLVDLTLVMVLLVGPNLLTGAEVADRRRPPTPRKSSVLEGHSAGEYLNGVTWVPTRETWEPAGPHRFRGLGVSTSTPPCGFTPSAAA
ncbi:hypothetical protein [Actinophytocola sp.]|uniref:hypothetical protein n=1 Tax=Actinophytocola sp. TaxID=1872138 RepID=UPI003D6C596C